MQSFKFFSRLKISTSQLTACVGLMQGDPKGIKSVWEPKEGGKGKSYQNCPGQEGDY